MKRKTISLLTVFTALGLAVLSPGAWAQSATAPKPPAALAPPTQHAFDKLPPADQKIAQALFDAQTPRRGRAMFSLDQIATMKQGGREWPEVLQRMRERGLLVQTEVDQVLRWYDAEQRELQQQRDMEKILGVGRARNTEQGDAAPSTRTRIGTVGDGSGAPTPAPATPNP
jgi:hypothetical protein